MPTVDDLLGGPQSGLSPTEKPAESQPVEWTDYLSDVPKGIGAGVVGFGQSLGDIANAGSRFVGAGNLIDQEYLSEDALPEWMKTKTMVGSLTSGFTQAAIGLIPLVGEAGLIAKAGQLGRVGAWLNTSGKAASLSRNLLQGAIVDTVAFQGDRGHLSDILKGMGGVGDNPITRYLSTHEDDSWIEGRVKNALEGGIIGTGLEAIAFPALKSLKAQLFGKSTEDVAKGIRGAADENVQLLLQDPKEASKRGIISPELAERLLKVDWSSDQFKPAGANRDRFSQQLTDALVPMKNGAEVAPAILGLTDANAKLWSALNEKSVDDYYAKFFAGVTRDELGKGDALFQVNPTGSILSGQEKVAVKATGQTGQVTLEDAARALESRQRLVKRNPAEGYGPKQLEELTNDLMTEAKHALQDPETVKGIGWYSKQVDEMVNTMSTVFPEIKTDPKSGFVFKTLLAVTSNGTNPSQNLRRASELFEQWQKTGNFVGKGSGPRGAAVEQTLKRVKALIDAKGGDDAAYADVAELFNSEMTAGEIKKLTGKPVPKESTSAKLKGAMMLGPKIGAFFSNLNGDHSFPTLDSWMYRQMNRIRGNLVVGTKELKEIHADSAARVQKVIAENPGIETYGFDPTKADKKGYLQGYSQRLLSDLQKRGYKNTTPLETWAKWHDGATSPLFETPRSAGEQDFFRNAMQTATKNLRSEMGIDLTPADLQAILWYHEKRLYEQLGIKGSAANREDFAAAARKYADSRSDRVGGLPSGSADAGAAEASGRRADPSLVLNQGELSLPRGRKADVSGQLPLTFPSQAPRGAVQFAQDGRALIHLFETADPSTVLHEVGHVFRRTLSEISPELLTKAEQALGVSFSGKGQSLVEAEEAWARGFEAYVSKGIAPTPELKTVFGQFKDWLTTVYYNIAGSPLKEKINPQLRDVFDAMLGKYGPADVTAPKPSSRLPNTPSKLVQSIRTAYMDSIGGNHPGRQRLADVHQPTAQRIADAYEALVHNPNDLAVKQSYDALLAETKSQFEQMQKQGIRLVPTDGNPYPSSQAMMDDVEKNKRLYIQKTISDTGGSDLPMDHPMMADSGLVLKDANGKDHKMLMNDVFRGVHDFFGHAAEGYQFGQRGEENAWIAHAMMFSPEARPAMTTETRGQNSWVNSGSHIRRPDGSIPVKGDADWVHPNDRPFAKQKAGLLPPWATQHVELGDAPAMAEAISSDLNAAAERGLSATESIDQAVRGSVNVSRIATTDEAVNVIKTIDNARDKAVGRMTMDEMTELITSADVSEDEVRAVLGNGKARESLQKHMSVIATARTMVVQAAENVARIHEELQHVANSGGDQQSIEEYAKALVEEMDRVTDFHNMVQEAKSDAGRLVKSFDLTASGEGVQFEKIAAAATDAAEGDAPTEDAIRRMIANAENKGNADKAEVLKALAEAKPKKTRADTSMDWLHGSGEDMGSVTDKATREPIEKSIDTTGAENAKPITAAENAAYLRANNGEQVGNFAKDRPAPRGDKIPDTTGAEIPGGPSVEQFQRSGGGEDMAPMRDGSKPKRTGTPGDIMPDTTGAEGPLGMSDKAAGGVPLEYSYVTVNGTRIPVNNLLKRSKGIAAAAQAGRAAVEADAKTAINAAKSGWFPIFLEFQKAALLSGMTTVTNNTLSGGIMTAMMPLVHMAGATVSGDTRAMKNSWGLMTQVFGAMRDVVSNTWTATPGEGQQGLRTLKSTIANEKPTLLRTDGIEHTPKLTAQGVGLSDASAAGKAANTLGRIVRLPFTAHQVMDEFFSNVNYLAYVRNKASQIAEERFINNASIPEAQRQQLASEFVDAYTKGAFTGEGGAITRADGKFFHEDAARYAKSVNFTQDLTYGLGQSLQKLKGSHPWLDMLLPFVTVPTNIVRMGMRMTPGLNLIANYSARLAGQSAEDVLKARGELAIGTAIWGSAIYMASSGGITGAGPTNPQELATLKASGWQPFSFVTTGADGKKEYVSYARLEPFSMMLGLAADFSDSAAYLQEGERNQFAAQAVTSLAHNITNKTYLTSLTDFLKAVTSPSENGAAYLRNRTAALVPNFFAKIGNAQDDSLRETRTMLDAIRNRLPFAREDSMPRRNLLGEVMTPPAGYVPFADTRDGAAGFIGRAASPVQFSRQSSDQVVNELASMGHAFGKVSPKIQGVDVSTFTNPGSRQTAYDRLQELSGEIRLDGRSMHDELERLINSRDYQKAPMPRDRSEQFNPRIQMLQRVMSRYRLAAQKQTLKEFPELRQALDGLKVEGKTGRDMSPVLAILSR